MYYSRLYLKRQDTKAGERKVLSRPALLGLKERLGEDEAEMKREIRQTKTRKVGNSHG